MDEISSELKLRLRTYAPAFIRDVLRAVQIVTEEPTVKGTTEGLEILAISGDHRHMISAEIKAEFFDEYEVTQEGLVTFDLKDLLKRVYGSRSGKLKGSRLSADIDGERIEIRGDGALTGIKTFKVLEPIGNPWAYVPDLLFAAEYRAAVEMLAPRLKQIFDDCTVSDYVTVEVDDAGVTFRCQSEDNLEENRLEHWADDILRLHAEGPQRAAYPVDLLKQIARAIRALSDVAALQFSEDFPTRITPDLGRWGSLAFYVAPAIGYDKAQEPEIDEPGEVPAEAVDVEEVPAEIPAEGVNIYQALEDLGFFAYSGEDGDLYRKNGLPGWRVSVYWGAHVRIQTSRGRDAYGRSRWATVREFGIEGPRGRWTPENAEAIEAVKELIEKGTLGEGPAEGPAPYACEYPSCEAEIPEGEEVRLEDGDTILCAEHAEIVESAAGPAAPEPAEIDPWILREARIKYYLANPGVYETPTPEQLRPYL